jgi:tRNA(fMet)-specific endonuclease VapC
MLDTNILIYLIKNKPESVTERVNALGEDDELCMSFVSYAELLKGAEGSSRKPDVLRRLDGMIRQVPVLYPVGPEICRHFAEQSSRLKTAGRPVGSNDLWIACHALAEAAVLVTKNEAEFNRVAGLRVENWAA